MSRMSSLLHWAKFEEQLALVDQCESWARFEEQFAAVEQFELGKI